MIRISDLHITADTWKNYDGNGFGEFKARASQVQNFELLDANGDIDPVKLQKLIDTVTYKAMLTVKRDVLPILANTDIDYNIFNADYQKGIQSVVLAQSEGLVTDGYLERKNASQVQGGDLSIQEDITGNLLSYDRVYEQAEDEAMQYGLNNLELKYDTTEKLWEIYDGNNKIAIRFASGQKVSEVLIEGTGNLVGKDELQKLIATGREKVEFIDAIDINDMLVDFDAFIKASAVKAHEQGEIVQVNYKGADVTYKDVHEDYVFDGINYLKFTYNIELKTFIKQSTDFLDDLEARKIDGEEAERRFLAKSKDEGNTEMDAAYVEAASKDIATYGKVQELIKVVANRAGNNETDIFELNLGNFDVNNDGTRIRNIFTELDALRTEADATAADLVTVKADAIALAAEVTALKGRGTYRGTYPSIDDAKAQVANPNNGDYVAIGNQNPYIEWIYNASSKTWEEAGVHQTTGKAFFKDGIETSTQSGAANSKAEQKVIDDKLASDFAAADARVLAAAKTADLVLETLVKKYVDDKVKYEKGRVLSFAEQKTSGAFADRTLFSERATPNGIKSFSDRVNVLSSGSITFKSDISFTMSNQHFSGGNISTNPATTEVLIDDKKLETFEIVGGDVTGLYTDLSGASGIDLGIKYVYTALKDITFAEMGK